MWGLSALTGLILLLAGAVIDIRYHKIPVNLLIFGGTGAILHHLIYREMNFFIILGGAGAGILFLLLSKVTEEGLGYGDSWAILILGTYLGLWKLLSVLFVAFLLLSVSAMIVLCVKKMSRFVALPFMPYLLAGYVAVILV